MTQDLTFGTPSKSKLGAHQSKAGVAFALFSEHADRVTLSLFSKDGEVETDQVELSRGTDHIWQADVKGLTLGQLYGYRVDGPYAPHEGHRFNANKLLIDPYAKCLSGDFIQHDALYGYDVNSPKKDLSFNLQDSAAYVPKCVVGQPNFDWEKVQKPRTEWSDTVLYEAHIKGLSMRHPDVAPELRGTLSAFSNPVLIDYLKDLGVTAIEFLPAQSFFSEPRLTEAGLTNYWGYNPVNYFAPHNAYLGPQGKTAFQSAVKALHKAGIEVILDVVYNHTAESWELGPTISYRGIDNLSYYRLQEDRRFYVNDTGCGNTFNITHPQVLDLTVQSLRYWAEEMHVDGFRFDLAPTLGRNPHEFDKNSHFFKYLKESPHLRDCKLIAEPWDIGPNGYALGGFPDDWREWNDKYRDDVRSFWKNDAGAHRNLAARLLGSSEQFDHSGKNALTSVNLITAHDGFNLHDTVSYTHKHNLANLEDNRDGHGHNLSDNMGIEGPSDNPEITRARQLRKKNMLATLFLSQGIPMLLAGDEFGHSQMGNNNAYCQDNDLTWLDWAKADKELHAFTKEVIALRKTYPHFSQAEFLHGQPVNSLGVKSVEWLSPSGYALSDHDWHTPDLACFGILLSMTDQDTLLMIINRGQPCDFDILDADWKQVLTTSNCGSTTAHIPESSVSVFKYSGTFISSKLHVEALRQRAENFGIEQSYRDISGTTHTTSADTNLALLTAMNALGDVEASLPISNEPDPIRPTVYGADRLRKSGKIWGVTAALYGLKSKSNYGLGDFEDLAVLAEVMAKKGADFIGINPVHALFPSAPHLYAPYSASSREFLNVMHIAVDKMPGAPALNMLDIEIPKSGGDLVNYETVYTFKQSVFQTAFETFSDLPKSHTDAKAFASFVKSGGAALRLHALFDVIFETLPHDQQTYDGWKNFPIELQDPRNIACTQFAKDHAGRIAYYMYLQWVADQQFRSAQARAVAAGMSVGLYIDFAVGVVPGGSDAWRYKSVFATGVSLGAPGDAANPDGQKWNLLPYDPHALVKVDFTPYLTALERTMSMGGAVRIDHILGLTRAFWIADDQNTGAYVRYPFDDMVTAIAKLSSEQNCIVFGEDLGTVPDGFRDQMSARDLMGCNVVLFERDSHGNILPPNALRATTMASFSNHDFPTLAGFWSGEDFIWREALGIGSHPDTLAYERKRREDDKSTLAYLAEHQGATHSEMNAELMAALMAALSKSPALAVSIQLEDLLLSPDQANVPGTTDQQPNWRRCNHLTAQEISTDPNIDRILTAVNAHRL